MRQCGKRLLNGGATKEACVGGWLDGLEAKQNRKETPKHPPFAANAKDGAPAKSNEGWATRFLCSSAPQLRHLPSLFTGGVASSAKCLLIHDRLGRPIQWCQLVLRYPQFELGGASGAVEEILARSVSILWVFASMHALCFPSSRRVSRFESER
jgi:hypothetical protein